MKRSVDDALRSSLRRDRAGCLVCARPAIAAETPAAAPKTTSDTYRQLDLFGEAFERVRANYVEPVTDEQLIEAAIKGMVSSLDPHSSYMNAKNFGDMEIQDQRRVRRPRHRSDDGRRPHQGDLADRRHARRQGRHQAGRLIAAIDGEPMQGMALNDAIDKMRGPVGSKITLTILRGDRQAVRRHAEARRDQDPVGQIRTGRRRCRLYPHHRASTSRPTAASRPRSTSLKSKTGAQAGGYVLDLRNNPGGLLDQAIAVSDDFLDARRDRLHPRPPSRGHPAL